MKKKSDNAQSSIIYDEPIAVLPGHVAEVVVEAIDADNLPDILYKPMCYLVCVDSIARTYSFYASIVVPKGAIVRNCTITQINSYNYVELSIDTNNTNTQTSLFFMSITGMPAPLGFQLSSVQLTVIGKDSSDEGGTKQGQGSTAVDYQDADGQLDSMSKK